MPIIEVKNLFFRYNGEDVLKDISFSVERSQFLAVLGPNGSGKSTLLRNISGACRPSAGTIRIDGMQIKERSKSEAARIMAVLPAEIFIPYDFSALEIVLMGRAPHLKWWRDYRDNDLDAAMEALKSVGVLELARRSVNSLSSGERQRVFLAQALAQQPRMLLLDEPTSHLDINHQLEIFELLAQFAAGKKITVLMASHDLNLACRHCGSILLLKDGRILSGGSPAEAITQESISAAYGPRITVSYDRTTGFPEIKTGKIPPSP